MRCTKGLFETGETELESNVPSPEKYEASPCFVSGGTMFNTHIKRKKAIMAVTKSAYATFHEPLIGTLPLWKQEEESPPSSDLIDNTAGQTD